MSLIKTPYAAVIVWNYEERISVNGFEHEDGAATVNETIISTLSLMSISTSKTKSNPVGNFNLVLAPTRNWTSVLTPGSWCAILMSNTPLVPRSFIIADASQLKMIGRIDAVRTNVSVNGDGARSTTYSVQGRDWCSIFENTLYVDPMIQDPSGDQSGQASAAYQAILNNCLDTVGNNHNLSVLDNITLALSVLGQPLNVPPTGRLFKVTSEVTLPKEVINFLFEESSTSGDFMKLLKTITGPLKEKGEDDYDESKPQLTGISAFTPSSLIGQHSLWSVIQEHSNYALNDVFAEMRWTAESEAKPEFRLYCRIKPFSYTDEKASKRVDDDMRSKFQNVRSHLLNVEAVTSINAGVNWADKFNFLEIKPDGMDPKTSSLFQNKSQASQGDNNGSDVYSREGFHPMIFSIRQLPYSPNGENLDRVFDKLEEWSLLAQEWYFDCHKFLNGTMTLYGSGEYIPVGDNIMFDAQLIGVTPNYNRAADIATYTIFVLAHVESVQNSFTVSANGERSFETTIGFVRGILVDKQKQLIGTGTIDNLASILNKKDSRNKATVFSSEEE